MARGGASVGSEGSRCGGWRQLCSVSTWGCGDPRGEGHKTGQGQQRPALSPRPLLLPPAGPQRGATAGEALASWPRCHNPGPQTGGFNHRNALSPGSEPERQGQGWAGLFLLRRREACGPLEPLAVCWDPWLPGLVHLCLPRTASSGCVQVSVPLVIRTQSSWVRASLTTPVTTYIATISKQGPLPGAGDRDFSI